MAIRVALNHKTHYAYDRQVTLQPHVIRLRPAPHCRSPIISYSLRVEPAPHFLNWQQDPYGNYQARVVFLKPGQRLLVEVDLVVEMAPYNPFDFFIEPSAERCPFEYEPGLARELAPYLECEPAGPLLQKLVESQRRKDIRSVDYLVAVNRCIQDAVKYVVRLEPGVQKCEETLTLGSGSCRDSAWLLVQTMRHLGLAARFASGYLIQLASDVKSLDGPSGPEKDFTDLHAWAEVYFPGAGWIGLDPTSGLLTGEGHIPLACAADPTSAAPVTGSFMFEADPALGDADRVEEDFQFHMSVTRILETPRVTKPYTEEQWQAIDVLGKLVDEDLQKRDVRLTMGGEPTFVSLDERDAPEWNTTALGTQKRRQGNELLRRLRDRFAPGAFLHFGQGKWYPGESLPRWAYACFWRRDGQPIWNDPSLIADIDKHYGHGPAEAVRFTAALAQRLGVDPKFGIPAFEDVWYYMWRERRLPANVDPLKSKLDDVEERKRLAEIFDQGLDRIVGYTLPLRRKHDENSPRWESGPWFLRREHLFLVPGDSPMGYRLPLDSLPWEAPESRVMVIEQDPFAPRGPLPPRIARQQRRNQADRDGAVARNVRSPFTGDVAAEVPGELIRTALCVEPREGRLHIFLPPATCLEDYLDLVTAIEDVAAAENLPVLIEGYKPPSDHRLNHLMITPDPGVLEVNVHPVQTWQEMTELTHILYEEAHLCRLSTEKFMLDGRHTGTGGGNHIVIGGPTPADSPVLRRPDLLRSLLGCWHNHPSLSYLFSSMFIGPTSQAPRVDEARNDSLYELEIAFQQIPDAAQSPPWLVDRVFRHLLTDVTGNTHRSEFCIDKLYSPDAAGDRRGLVEFRAFEMPPHARMSLVQQLLLRALIARFWKAPNRQKLARWGTELHDRFMLPHFVEQDFEDLLDETAQAGYRLEKSWFAPHMEFRFPSIGGVTYRGVNLELRQAMEPWHVLGEESAAGGTARYVDSSVERVQVKVRGLIGGRHVILCNGRRVPLHPTGVNGEFVAAVRYRAWQPPSCLHPTIPVHSPLIFDVCDTWSGRSIGGCQYHVSHPGGRSYEIFPVNATEAESRRHSRFFPFGHTPGKIAVPATEIQPECPFTLDLRQAPPGLPVEEARSSRLNGRSASPEMNGHGILEDRFGFTMPTAATESLHR